MLRKKVNDFWEDDKFYYCHYLNFCIFIVSLKNKRVNYEKITVDFKP